MNESKPSEPAGRNPGWEVAPGPDDQGEAEFLRELIHAPDAPDLTGALAEHYRLQGEDGETTVPTCTHDDKCRVALHPRGPHGELGDVRWPSALPMQMQIRQPCPAYILLAWGGQPVNCSEPAGHDKPGPNGEPGTNHKITVEWRVY